VHQIDLHRAIKVTKKSSRVTKLINHLYTLIDDEISLYITTVVNFTPILNRRTYGSLGSASMLSKNS